jgi:transposase-like protein
MPAERRHFTGAQKMAILRLHLLERIPISEVCQKHGLQPTAFYLWQKKLFEEGAALLERPAGRSSRGMDARQIEALEAKLREKNEALAELVTEYMAVKKGMGRL